MLELGPESGTLTELRANALNCCPKGGGGTWFGEEKVGGGVAGTPIAIPPLGGGGRGEIDGGAGEEKGGTGKGEEENWVKWEWGCCCCAHDALLKGGLD